MIIYVYANWRSSSCYFFRVVPAVLNPKLFTLRFHHWTLWSGLKFSTQSFANTK